MAQHDNLYQRSIFYDIVFNRDVSREVDFMLALYRRYTGQTMQSVLDIACGPGYHARAFARRGLRAVGLDLRPEMVRFAADQAAAEAIEVEWLTADMRGFELAAPVDMAITVFDGIDALLTNEDMTQHLQTVAANLTANGLYLIEHTHPRDCSLTNYGSFHYGGQRNGITVEINWAINNPAFDLVTGVAQTEIEMRVDDHGQKQVIHDYAQERILSPQEIGLLVQLSGALELVGWYGDFDLQQGLDNSPASKKMIAVLQKMR